jgi:hypothetical protein
MERRDFIEAISSGLAGLLFPEMAFAENENLPKRKHMHTNYARIPVPRVGYKHIVNEPPLTGVDMSDISTRSGRIERALRWRNIAEAVSGRYGMSSRMLLGMICVESEGDPTQPNGSGDGGAGLIHMQPMLASAYGLKMITNSKKLVDHEQGRKLKKAIEATGGDLKDLIAYDERFHPIKNVDAAARMVCDHYESRGGRHSWNKALERYAGRKEYDGNVNSYVANMASSNFMNNLRSAFNERNKNFKINGQTLTFDAYIKAFNQANRNYGLDDYKKLGRQTVE